MCETPSAALDAEFPLSGVEQRSQDDCVGEVALQQGSTLFRRHNLVGFRAGRFVGRFVGFCLHGSESLTRTEDSCSIILLKGAIVSIFLPISENLQIFSRGARQEAGNAASANNFASLRHQIEKIERSNFFGTHLINYEQMMRSWFKIDPTDRPGITWITGAISPESISTLRCLMKLLLAHRYLFVSVILLFQSLAQAAPALDKEGKAGEPVVILVPEGGLVRDSSIEIRFPAVMVTDAQVGQSLEASEIMKITPPMEGKFTWRSRFSGTFQPGTWPSLGTKFSISLAANLKDGAGNAVPVPKAVVALAPKFQVTRRSPEWFSGEQRDPVIYLYFNDAVDAANASEGLYFKEKTGKLNVPANVSLATSDMVAQGTTPMGTYAEQFKGGIELKKKQVVSSVLRVSPSEPLPPGEQWRLHIDAGLRNLSKTATMGAAMNVDIATIRPMKIVGISPQSPLDEKRMLEITFNKQLPKAIPGGTLKRIVTVSPAPEDLEWTVSANAIVATGAFEIDQPYTVIVLPGVAALDGLKLEDAKEEVVNFTPHPAGVALASFDHSQWLGGKGELGIDSANNSELTVQIKRVDPNNIVYALRGYESYQNDESNQGGYTRIPYAAMPGKTVWKKKFTSSVELDKSEHFDLLWEQILGGRKAGVYFVSVEGQPKEKVENGSVVGAQSLVQLTDIGLAWKFNRTQATIFVFNHTTGQPMKDVQLATFDDDANPLESRPSDGNGLATLGISSKTRWLVAVGNQDWHGIAFHPDMSCLDMWDFGINYRSPSDGSGETRDTLIFTDRPVYQPGEEVFLKVITRKHSADGLALHANKEARLRAYDMNQQVFLDKKVTFSGTGSYNDSVKLPIGAVGHYHIGIDFMKSEAQIKEEAERRAKAEAEGESDETEQGEGEETETDEESDQVGGEEPNPVESSIQHNFLVQEYQPNAFKVSFNAGGIKPEGEIFHTPVKAAYFMGKGLSDATLKWDTNLSQANFRAEKFPDYHFCHAKRYQVYDGTDWRQVEREGWHAPLTTGQGEVKLSAKGEAVIPARVPASFGVPGPKELTVSGEITDINQQTIAGNLEHIIHSSEFYVGVKQGRSAYFADTEIPIEVVAVRQDGKRYHKPVTATLLVEHLVWNAVKVQVAGGGTDIRHDLAMERESEQGINISPEASKEKVAALKLSKPGTYNLTITAKDAQNAVVKTVVSLDVFGRGSQDGTWAQNDGVKIDLTPDKQEYKPGEVAKIIVKSPLKGTALVTIEREKVLKSWLTKVDGKGGAIEVPLEEGFAPNCFVSVVQIRGGEEDKRDSKQPDYRVGLCELTVESRKHELSVELILESAEVSPGAPVSVTCMVKDSAGQPVPNAEVALWAADDGVLSLVGYEMPDVVGAFHYAEPLRVTTGISLGQLLSESLEDREYANKGFVIGGGDSLRGESGQPLRKNFKALAYWNPSLKTGVDGKVNVSFPAPDNLTQFKIQAIVNEGVGRFGQGESEFKVNKPLMLEPAMPRFANVGDEIVLKAVVHNTTENAGEISLTLQVDERVVFPKIDKESSVVKTLAIAAGQSKAAYFPVRFAKTGTATFKWSATAPNGPKGFADAVETTLEVGTTEPMLRDVRFINVGTGGAGKNLLHNMSPELLDGPGAIKLVVSNNRLVEGSAAIEQLLHYPYGCVEQTTSALLPWLALKDLKNAVPGIKKTDAETTRVIQKAADRLLSMQTRNGGLAYWSGEGEPLFWASAQGGMGLVLASKAGANVPATRIDKLMRYLSKSLRTDDPNPNAMADMERCFACYTLALAGKAEAPYHEVLYQRRADLSTTARALLAMAVAESNGDVAMATELLGKKKDEGKILSWFGSDSDRAIRSMAWLKVGDAQRAHSALEAMLERRAPRGDWNNTFNNGWVVQALAAHAKSMKPWDPAKPGVLSFNGKEQKISFGPEAASQTVTFTTAGGGALPTLTANVPEGVRLFGYAEISARATKNLDKGRSSGFAVARTYQKVDSLGVPQIGAKLHVGDLVLVSLNLDIPGDCEYLVVDDPLPATLEGVNPKFKTMATNAQAGKQSAQWSTDYQEMRGDRVLFFRNQFTGSGRFSVQYLARVVAEGTVTAPPARIEAMYDPAQFGLCPAEKLTTMSGNEEEVAVR